MLAASRFHVIPKIAAHDIPLAWEVDVLVDDDSESDDGQTKVYHRVRAGETLALVLISPVILVEWS